MKFFTVPALLAAARLSAAVVVPWLPVAKNNSDLFLLEARLRSSVAGRVQVYYGTGAGFSEAASSRADVAPSIEPIAHRLALPPGNYRAIRLDPLDRGGTEIISSLRVITRSGRVVRELPLAAF